MHVQVTDITLLAFSLFNLLRLTSYIPQIITVARDRNGARAISLSCWTIWVAANVSTAAYAWINLGDIWLAAVSVFNALCCMTVLMLVIIKRLRPEPSTGSKRMQTRDAFTGRRVPPDMVRMHEPELRV